MLYQGTKSSGRYTIEIKILHCILKLRAKELKILMQDSELPLQLRLLSILLTFSRRQTLQMHGKQNLVAVD